MYSVNWHSSDGHGTESRTTIHVSDCVWPQRYGDGPKWRHFETLERAVKWAETSPYPLNYCPCATRYRDTVAKIEAMDSETRARILRALTGNTAGMARGW